MVTGMSRLLAPSRLARALLYLASGVVVWAVTLLGLAFLIPMGFVGAPLASIALGRLERRRLALLGQPVPPDPHRPAPRFGASAQARFRLAEAATWREFAYAVALATFVGVLDTVMVVTMAALTFATFVRPFIEGEWPGSVAIGATLVAWILLTSVVAHGHAALARSLLSGPTDEDMRDLTAARARLVDAFEVERRRIERDLHDGAQQGLVALTMTLGLAAWELRDGPVEARRLVDRAGELATTALAEMRDLVRGIHPQVLTDHGLLAAVDELIGRAAVPVTSHIDLDRRLPSIVESTAYFVIGEALTNATKHAHATRVTICGGLVGETLAVEVCDDGVGGADPDGGSGLAGLADRVGAVGGRLTLTSPPGGPTLLRLELPCSGS